MDASFLSKLKDWRKSKGLAQTKLAEMAGLSLTTLRLLEMGKQKPQAKTLEKIAETIKKVNAGELPVEKTVEIENPPRKKAKAEPVAEPKPEPTPLTVKVPEESSAIRLSNLDLELIRRILNMTEREKLNILQSLID